MLPWKDPWWYNVSGKHRCKCVQLKGIILGLSMLRFTTIVPLGIVLGRQDGTGRVGAMARGSWSILVVRTVGYGNGEVGRKGTRPVGCASLGKIGMHMSGSRPRFSSTARSEGPTGNTLKTDQGWPGNGNERLYKHDYVSKCWREQGRGGRTNDVRIKYFFG